MPRNGCPPQIMDRRMSRTIWHFREWNESYTYKLLDLLRRNEVWNTDIFSISGHLLQANVIPQIQNSKI